MTNQIKKEGTGKPVVRVRIWPALLILLAQFIASQTVSFFGSTIMHSALGLAVVPLAATGLLVVWWLTLSRAPVLDRIAGVLLVVGAVLYVKESRGILLLAFALPAMTTGTVLTLAVTRRLRWPVARWLAVAYVIACAGLFLALRTDELGGGFAPVVSWRWSPTEAEVSAAVPTAQANGTAVLPAQPGPGDWAGFRGPLRDGIVPGVRFSADWRTPPRELWRRKVGSGWSSFAAIGDYVFTQEQRGGEELVTCYAAATGADVWVNRTVGQFQDNMGLGPRATPTFCNGRLYTQGATGTLQCLDAATGNILWKRDLTKDAETPVPTYGFASSPLIAGELVIAFNSGQREGKSAMAYDRATGAPVWSAGRGTEVYSSPQLAVIAGVPQLLMLCDYGLLSFVPETGARLVDYPWNADGNQRCVQPLVVGDRVMVGTTGKVSTRMLRIEKNGGAWTAREEWTCGKFRPYFNDGALHKGFFYGFDGERFACLDIATGERRWEGKRYGGQLLLIPDMETLLILSNAGDVALVPATPERFSETARFKAVGGKTWNHPVIAHGRLFVRNATEAACFELPPLP